MLMLMQQIVQWTLSCRSLPCHFRTDVWYEEEMQTCSSNTTYRCVCVNSERYVMTMTDGLWGQDVTSETTVCYLLADKQTKKQHSVEINKERNYKGFYAAVGELCFPSLFRLRRDCILSNLHSRHTQTERKAACVRAQPSSSAVQTVCQTTPLPPPGTRMTAMSLLPRGVCAASSAWAWSVCAALSECVWAGVYRCCHASIHLL